jgi:hypothetical protein
MRPGPFFLRKSFDNLWMFAAMRRGIDVTNMAKFAPKLWRLAMEGERDPVRLHDGALEGLIPATAWREAS